MEESKSLKYWMLTESCEDELTRWGFISHMKHYIKQLLTDPLHASVDPYLLSFGIDNKKALEMLMHRPDEMDPRSAVIIRIERIKQMEEGGKDKFTIQYRAPREEFEKKLKNCYKKFILERENGMLNECEGGDGVNTPMGISDGPFDAPLGGVIRKKKPKTLILNQEQVDKLKEEVESTGMAGGFGFGYDAPAFSDKETRNHNDICKDDNLTQGVKDLS